MARHSRKHNRQFYVYGATKVPSVTQDRYYSADWVRDMRYNEQLAARAMLDLLGVTSVLVSGGLVTQGSSVTTANITAAVGFCDFDVEVPADDQTWSIPALFETRQIAITARSPALTNFDLSATSMVFDGSTPNYLKLRYLENNVKTRTRKYGETTYSYAVEDSYAIVCDTSTVTAKDVLLATLVGNGTSTLTITQNTATAKVLKASSADNAESAISATSAGTCTGNSVTATKLMNARNIDGVIFDGTSDIETPENVKRYISTSAGVIGTGSNVWITGLKINQSTQAITGFRYRVLYPSIGMPTDAGYVYFYTTE